MLLYLLKTLAFGIPYSVFVDYFQISIQYGMKLCQEFDTAIKTLYMCEFSRLPGDVNLRIIEKLHHNVYSVSGMLGFTVLIQNGKIVQKHGQVHIMGKKTLPQFFFRELWTIICFLAFIIWLSQNTQQ